MVYKRTFVLFAVDTWHKDFLNTLRPSSITIWKQISIKMSYNSFIFFLCYLFVKWNTFLPLVHNYFMFSAHQNPKFHALHLRLDELFPREPPASSHFSVVLNVSCKKLHLLLWERNRRQYWKCIEIKLY